MPAKPPQAYRARYIFPGLRPPIEGGVLHTRNDLIVAVKSSPESTASDLGEVAILPGLVNAHTHLEFSDLHCPLGNRGMQFPNWLRCVITERRNRSISSPTRSVQQGLWECLASGVTTVGEIATSDWTDPVFPNTPQRCVLFREQIALSVNRFDEQRNTAEQWLEQVHDLHLFRGLSPHAPYTVHPNLVSEICRLSGQYQVPLTMHLAESMDELELLTSGSGPMMEFLSELGAWDPAAIPRGIRIMDYLHLLAKADHGLVIHGNFLSNEEIRYLADSRDRLSVVYCPRTHDFFEHGPYPLRSMLEAGVRIALGTDSRASNPDLDLMEEFRFLCGKETGLSPSDLLALITVNPAEALGLQQRIGNLEPGKAADFIVVDLPQRSAVDPHDLLADPNAKVRQVYIAGQLVYDANPPHPDTGFPDDD